MYFKNESLEVPIDDFLKIGEEMLVRLFLSESLEVGGIWYTSSWQFLYFILKWFVRLL